LEDSGNFWLGAFVGFLVIAALGWILPIIAHLLGGFLAGLIARGNMGRGALAGLLAGVFGGVISLMLLISGMTALWGFLFAPLGIGLSEALGLAIRIVAIFLSVFGIVVAAAGGLVGDVIYELIYAP
jgi:hypothetical protein